MASGRWLERVERQGRHRESALHVAGAAAVESVPVAAGFERRRRPPVGLLGGDHVDVPVEQQRRPLPRAGATDHVETTVVRELGNARERVGPDPIGDREPLDLEAEPLQLLLDDPLRFVLTPHRAGGRDQVLEERERCLGAFGDRVVELLRVQTGPSSMVECLVQIPR
jgi:hypothetical protein